MAVPENRHRGSMLETSKDHGVIARAYTPADRDDCLALFDGNVPAFFSSSERQDFEQFLARRAMDWRYQVLGLDSRVVGCGGLAIEEDGMTAALCWGMIHREFQGMGLGRMLTESRLRSAAATPGIMQVRLDTSQHTQGFYARFGFQVSGITQDGYGLGLDRWDMLLRFDDNQRQMLQAGN